MKPFVIYIDKEAKRMQLTKEQFEKYLSEAYDQGYSDACSSQTLT